jgi:hypothetical protein
MSAGRLQAALEAADERKRAVLQDPPDGIHLTAGDLQDRAIFLGFDIDYTELVEISHRAAALYAHQAMTLPLVPLFLSCWVDGLLIGLFAAKQPAGESREEGADAPVG